MDTTTMRVSNPITPLFSMLIDGCLTKVYHPPSNHSGKECGISHLQIQNQQAQLDSQVYGKQKLFR